MRLNARMALSIVVFSFLVTTAAFADHSININTADKVALTTLNGIGDVKAQAIIDYRETNGPFGTIEDITHVSGIGTATFDKIKDHITVQGGNSYVTAPSIPPSSQKSSPSSQAPPPTFSASDLVVEGGSDHSVIAGAGVQFSARAYRNKEILENVSFMWNFGDGSTAEGASVTHPFEYPGRYAVVVTGGRDGATGSDRFTVTAELAQLAVRALSDGSLEIENLAGRDIDLSRWIVQSSGQRFSLPDNSSVLAKQIMRISPNTLHFYAGNMAELAYPDGTIAFRAKENSEIVPALAPAITPILEEIPSGSAKGAKKNTQMVQDRDTPDVSERIQEKETPVQLVATSSQAAAVGESTAGSWKWWLGAFAVSAFAGGAVFVSRRLGKKEWNIIEDTSE